MRSLPNDLAADGGSGSPVIASEASASQPPLAPDPS
jgi:hypothetical protein